MYAILIVVGTYTKQYVLLLFNCYHLVTHKLTICNIALILLQNKALGTWNSLIQKSGFPNPSLRWLRTIVVWLPIKTN